MDKLEQIIAIISACLGLIGTITGLLISLVKNVKAKNRLTTINKLTVALQAFVEDAETFVNYSGAEKKEYVMTKANRFAIDNNIPYDENAVSDIIENIVKISKSVNVREKDKKSINEAPVVAATNSEQTVTLKV